MSYSFPMQRIIFLDIDGPVIPGTMYCLDRHCSWQKNIPPMIAHAVNTMCERTEAKIVFNTTHNRVREGEETIFQAMVRAGFDPAHLFTADPATHYPKVARDQAVTEWLGRHPDTDWLALDDCEFTNDERLIRIDPHVGITLLTVNEVIGRWNGKPVIVML